jgi:hypothetical protein
MRERTEYRFPGSGCWGEYDVALDPAVTEMLAELHCWDGVRHCVRACQAMHALHEQKRRVHYLCASLSLVVSSPMSCGIVLGGRNHFLSS